MKDLIEDLLQLSRIGRAPVEGASVSANAILDDVKLELGFALQEKDATLSVQPGLPTINVDRVRMTEVFRNLISNAIKYNDKPAPVIEVGSQPGNGACTFFVRDNGIGIDERFHEKIFRIFQRLHHRDEYEGTGVGLTICKKIVEAHGGTIWLESRPGQGTTFFFTIPKAVAATRDEADKEGRLGHHVASTR